MLNSINVNADIIICDKEPTIDEPKMYFDKAIANGVKVIDFTDIGENSYDIIVDCIFGIGFHGQPRAPFSEIFDYINNSGAKVVSIDTPSGTNSTDGSVVNAVKADYTIAISALKLLTFCLRQIPIAAKFILLISELTKVIIKIIMPKQLQKRYKKEF